MIISGGRKYIFVHIPKTGGTSLALALEARAKKDDIMMGDTPKARNRRRRLKDIKSKGRLWKHSTLQDIEGLIAPSEIKELFAFTLVRNPWDRLVSYYRWLQTQNFDHRAVTLAKTLSFRDFLFDRHTEQSFRKAPYQSYLNFNGEDLADLFIRLEHFEEDAEPLFEHLGFTINLPHTNASHRLKEFQTYYDIESAEQVARICAEDIARFRYSF